MVPLLPSRAQSAYPAQARRLSVYLCLPAYAYTYTHTYTYCTYPYSY